MTWDDPAMEQSHNKTQPSVERNCPECGMTSDNSDRFCRRCGHELNPDIGAIEAYLGRILPERIDLALKDRVKEQKVVELETVELIAERAIKWLKAFAFFLGIPGLLIAGILSF
jgi:hypothetical protein